MSLEDRLGLYVSLLLLVVYFHSCVIRARIGEARDAVIAQCVERRP
jgi:hypothetical protein